MTENAQAVETPGTNKDPREAASAPPAPPSPPTAPRKRMNPKLRILLLLGIPVLLVAGFFTWRYMASYESTDDAQIDAHIHPASARISGYVVDVPITDNQFVQKGTVLVRIDPRDYQVAVDQAQADLAAAEAKARGAGINVPITSANTNSSLREAQADVEDTQAGITAAQQQVAAADAALKEAESNDWKAQNDLERYTKLVAKQEISQQQFDQAVATAKTTAAGVAAARASAAAANQQVTQARSKLLEAQAGVHAAQTGPQQVANMRSQAESALADVQQKQAKLAQAELNLGYTTIVAPVSGIVYRKVEVGENVSPGQELVSVVPVENIYVTANFKETQLKNMRVGQRAAIHVDAFGRDYNGRVESIAGASGSSFSLLPPENATGNYVKVVQRVPVKIVLDPGQDDAHLLRVGMSAEPKVYLK